MLLRKPLPLWINVSLFAGAIAMIPLAGLWGRRPVSTPRTLSEFTERLSRSMPSLHVVHQFPGRPECPVWVCTRPQSREQVWGLIRAAECGQQWQGIVFCERMGPTWVVEAEDEFIRNNWGQYGVRVGPFVLFGDPDLLQRIRDVILDYES
jgi:hypothetical protein